MRVLVSSALGHLDAYRAAVVHVCRRYRFEPVFMEEFDPERTSPEEVCRELASRCDAIVVLLAHRYGTPVPGDGRSFTELEYEAAPAVDGMPILAWLVHDETPWPPKEIERGESAERLGAFKERVRRHVVGTFTEDLARFREDVAVALAALPTSRRPGLAEAALAARERLRPRAPDVVSVPPYIGGMAFTGRQRERDWLDAWAGSTDPVGVVEAIGGTGKSALTWDWFQHSAPDSVPGLAGRFWWSFYEPANTMLAFQQQLLVYLTDHALPDVEVMESVDVVDALFDALDRRPVLVVMDGLERLLNAYQHHFDAGQVDDAAVEGMEVAFASGMTDAASYDFVRRLVSLRTSKVLISTRLLPDALRGLGTMLLPGVRHLLLPGLRTGDTRRLLERLGIKHGYADVRTFFDRLDNHPLLIGVVAGLVKAYRPAPGDFDRWVADPDHGARFTIADLPLTQRSHHILEHALDGLDPMSLRLLQRISIPGGLSTWEMVQVINPFLPSEQLRPVEWDGLPPFVADYLWKRRQERTDSGSARMALARLDAALDDLQARGLLWWNQEANSYDLHPVVRAYTYDTTPDEERRATNVRLARDHFGRLLIPEPERGPTSVEELLVPIGFFRALAGSGFLAQAERLWRERLSTPLVYVLRANLVSIQLLREFLVLAEASGLETSLDWDLAVAEEGAGRIEQALGRQIARTADWGRDLVSLQAGILNLADTASRIGRQAMAVRYADLADELTVAMGDDAEDRARAQILRVGWLLMAEDNAGALALVEQLLAGPENRLQVNWRATLLAGQFRALHRLGRDREIEPVVLDEWRFGTSLSPRMMWAGFVWEYASDRGDHETARRAAALTDRCIRQMGHESLPVDAALSAARTGAHAEATDILDRALHRFDRVHPAERPYQLAALTLQELGRVEEAAAMARSAYVDAWGDGPPYADQRSLGVARRLLAELGVSEPVLATRDFAGTTMPGEVALREAMGNLLRQRDLDAAAEAAAEVTRVGITGHRYFAEGSLPLLEAAVSAVLDGLPGRLEAVTSLAVGADQLLARLVLARGGTVTFVRPCRAIATTYLPEELAEFERLRDLATVVDPDGPGYDEPGEGAFLAAGQEVLARSDVLIAIWDGLPAVGRGGTADVVAAARELGVPHHVLWPDGVARA